MRQIKRHLKNNHGDESMERLVIIAIAFIAGALLIAAVWSAISTSFVPGLGNNIKDWLR